MTRPKNNFLKQHFSGGFTLTELMMTAALATLLAGLALPTLNNQTKKAKFIDAESH